jgi:hypothetical protein
MRDRQSTLRELDLLTKMQDDALSSATFVGMTEEQAQVYAARRSTIMNLVQDLLQVE